MTNRAIASVFLILGSTAISSCAYMQSHKNIEEAQRTYTGYELTNEVGLYKADGKYYIAAEKQQLRRHYPIIHDSVFLDGNNEPSWEKLGSHSQKAYHQISDGTAAVLQRKDGYATLDVLSDEIQDTPELWSDTLPKSARLCHVQAEICGSSSIIPSENAEMQNPLFTKIVSTLDQVCIDWPGTVLYNVSIPVMAPFVFFYQFLNEN